jgi:hypothetical protein
MFDDTTPRYKMLKFKIPVWKRVFDIVFSALAIIILSPVFLLTAIAIRLESKGPVIFKSKRVGTNYTILHFLKFRSMYCDAEERLKEVAKEAGNQYLEKNAEQEKKEEDHTITAPLGAEAEMMMMDMGMESDMMISDDEVMLVGDDYVVAESDFAKEKQEEIESAFVRLRMIPALPRWVSSSVNTALMSFRSSSTSSRVTCRLLATVPFLSMKLKSSQPIRVSTVSWLPQD